MNNLMAMLAAQSMVLTDNATHEIFNGIHISKKDAPPTKAIQEEIIAKAIAKRERKERKRLYDNFRNKAF